MCKIDLLLCNIWKRMHNIGAVMRNIIEGMRNRLLVIVVVSCQVKSLYRDHIAFNGWFVAFVIVFVALNSSFVAFITRFVAFSHFMGFISRNT